MEPTDKVLNQAREELRRRKRKRARGDALERSLAKKLGISDFMAREVLDRLRQEGSLEGQWNMRTGFTGMVEILLAPPRSELESSWEAAMKEAGVNELDVARLMPCAHSLQGLSCADMKRLASGLLQLRENQQRHIGEPRYRVSARYLLESSKALDGLPSSALRAFGIDPDNFASAPFYVMVAGPSAPDQVILVENPQAFEEGVKARLADTAWVATQGYGLSRNGEAFGNQLVRLVEERLMVPLVRAGVPPSLEKLFAHERLFFWGDLDPAGMDIFRRLKRILPHIRLSGLYRPMLESVERGGGHPLVPLAGKGGQEPLEEIDWLPGEMTRACKCRGVDQESVARQDIRKYADAAF